MPLRCICLETSVLGYLARLSGCADDIVIHLFLQARRARRYVLRLLIASQLLGMPIQFFFSPVCIIFLSNTPDFPEWLTKVPPEIVPIEAPVNIWFGMFSQRARSSA